ncbi:MAG: hypothetical protein ABJC74_04505 [Gemmatimonadota bacterium]
MPAICSGRVIALMMALVATTPLAAQRSAWSLGLTGAFSDFRGGARDPGGISVEPSSRPELGLVLGSSTPRWWFDLSLTWAPGHLSTRDSTGEAIQVDILRESFPRLRIGPLLGRTVVGIGQGALAIQAGPLFDLWSGDDTIRPRFGGQLRLVLEAPLGALLLRNYLGWSVEGSPFNESEFGPTIRRPAVQALSAGIELRLKL